MELGNYKRRIVPSNAWFAIALTGESFARYVETSNRIAVTAFAAIARHNVEVAILAFITIAPVDVRFAATISRQLIAYGNAIIGLLSARRIAWTLFTIAVRQSQWIAKVSRQTLFAMRTVCVVNTFQAISGGAIAIAHRIGINISITIAWLTQLNASN